MACCADHIRYEHEFLDVIEQNKTAISILYQHVMESGPRDGAFPAVPFASKCVCDCHVKYPKFNARLKVHRGRLLYVAREMLVQSFDTESFKPLMILFNLPNFSESQPPMSVSAGR